MYQYFMHSTANLVEIIKDGKLDEHYSEHETDYPMEKGIYCHYIFDGIPNVYSDLKWIYKPPFTLVIDISIAKVNKMYVCNSVSYGSCINHPKDRILYSNGNRKTLPNFKPLQQFIINKINTNVKEKELNRLHKNSSVYIHGHEVLFKGQIPLTYIKAILIHNKTYKKLGNKINILDNFFKKKNLSIKLIPYAPHTKNFHKYFEMI